mgnify:CR=1 FL=1
MLLAAAFALGVAVGWRRASQRGGDRLDKVQFGIAHGILFALIALALLILAQRTGML